MTLLQIVAVTMGLVSIAQSYGFGGSSAYGGGMPRNGAGWENSMPKPYDFAIQSTGAGAMSYRSETADGSGNVRGSYGYSDNQGLYRKVEYTAGAQGFQASVKTNEPGTDSKPISPADVHMMAEAPPTGIQEKYTRHGNMGGVFNGAHGTTNVASYGRMGGESSGLFSGIKRSEMGKSI